MGNIALNKTTAASNSVLPYAPSKAVDGLTTSFSRWLCNKVPGWMSVDLATPRWINRWVVKHMPVTGWRSPDYVNCDFKLQGCNDNASWLDINLVTGNLLSTTDLTINPVCFRFYRVYITKGLKINPQIASIVELELYEVPPTSSFLSGLTLSSGTLSPGFNKTGFAYKTTVDNSISSLTLTPVAEDSKATIKVNGTIVPSGTASTQIPLNVGTNTITVAVTAQVGGGISNYTVTVTRQDNNNNLRTLTVQTGTLSPEFAKDTLTYTVAVGFDTKSITITPTAESPAAAITVNSITVISGEPTGPILLNVGSNSIPVAVTASNVTKNYMITVTRADSAYLNALTGQCGEIAIPLSPSPFDKSTMNYIASVDYGTDTITVTPTAEDSNASITVNGTTINSGTPSGDIPLTVGENIIAVVVTASGGLSQGYSIKITRSDSSYLSALTANSGSTPIALSPSPFAKTAMEYMASVANNISTMTVTPIAESSIATITVNGSPVTSGNSSDPVQLDVGTNKIIILVSTGGMKNNYIITVTRAAASNNLLSSLTVTTSLDPVFSPGTFNYVTHAGPRLSLKVTPVAQSPTAIVTVNGTLITPGNLFVNVSVVDGTIIIIEVIDAGLTTTYKITAAKP